MKNKLNYFKQFYLITGICIFVSVILLVTGTIFINNCFNSTIKKLDLFQGNNMINLQSNKLNSLFDMDFSDMSFNIEDWDLHPVFTSESILSYLKDNPNLTKEQLDSVNDVICQYEIGIQFNKNTVDEDVIENITNARTIIDKMYSELNYA